MKKYIIYTIVEGNSYIICVDKNGKPFVKNGPSDDQVLKFDNIEDALRIAKTNSVKGTVYKVKELIL